MHLAWHNLHVQQVVSTRRHRSGLISSEKQREEEKKIKKEWEDSFEGFQMELSTKIFSLTDQVSNIYHFFAWYCDT